MGRVRPSQTARHRRVSDKRELRAQLRACLLLVPLPLSPPGPPGEGVNLFVSANCGNRRVCFGLTFPPALSSLSLSPTEIAGDIAVLSPPAGVIQFLPTVERIVYGVGVAASLRGEIERLAAHRAMLVTHRSLAASAAVSNITSQIGPAHAGAFAAALEHVPLEQVDAAVREAARVGADLIVAVGGGSAIDAAKALRVCLAAGLRSGGQLRAFMDNPRPLTTRTLPQISVPTTLSGAEYTRSFSSTDLANGLKRSYTDSGTAGRVIVYDPALTFETPMPLWLGSGVTALSHAIEVLCASPAHPVGDTLKLAAARELLAALPATRTTPHDADARLRCQLAAWMCDHSPLRAQPLQSSPASLPSHALAYELCGLCRMPYHVVACVTLAPCLRFCAARSSRGLSRQAEVARALKLAAEDASDVAAAHALADAVERFVAQLGLPGRIRDTAVPRESLSVAAKAFVARKGSLVDGIAAVEDDVINLLEAAW
jgi:maleylacetate reductase